MSEKLKPCPFCGSLAYYFHSDDDDIKDVVMCVKCRANIYGKGRKKIIDAWNTRTEVKS